MNECCRETLKKYILYINDLGYIDIHGDITVDSLIDDFIESM